MTGLPAWFAEGAPALVERVRDEGGFTVDAATGASPTAGFAVHADGRARVLPAASFFADGPAVLAALLGERPPLLGAFYDRGTERVVLSRVECFADRDEALAAGVARRQTDVYDLAAGRCVPTGYVRPGVSPGDLPNDRSMT